MKEGIFNDQWESPINQFKVFQTELCFYDEILVRGDRIVIPSRLRHHILEPAHEDHPGIVAMKNRLRSKVWWPKMDVSAEKNGKIV